ncbi:Aldehyde reductase 2 [Paramyrothecium foliicola]|nr:Aldehyde reductase 2 [Paramyrothecium foliicola]
MASHTMPATTDTAIPKGSLVLVTGVNGLVGSFIADYFLQNGYKVRGTARSTAKAAWVQNRFDKQYPGNFEVAEVPVMTEEGAFDEAAKGTSAFIHVASDVSFGSDPNKIIPVAIAGATSAIKSAFAEPSIKRFVLTSSSSASGPIPTPETTEVSVLDVDVWNEQSIKTAWAEPPYEADRVGAVYAASKTQAEQEVWKYYRENKEKRPDLIVNTVLPDMNFGKSLDLEAQGYTSSLALVKNLYDGQVTPFHHVVGNQDFIHVSDTAALHFAAAVLPDVKEERVFGFAGHYTWNGILAILRRNFPDKTFPEDFESNGLPYEVRPRARAVQLLQELGRPGFISLEETVLDNVK